MTTYHFIPGATALSPFKSERLINDLQKAGVPVESIHARYEHYVFSETSLDEQALQQVQRLLG